MILGRVAGRRGREHSKTQKKMRYSCWTGQELHGVEVDGYSETIYLREISDHVAAECYGCSWWLLLGWLVRLIYINTGGSGTLYRQIAGK